MSRQINLPINQVRLTNVAIVRMNKGGKRFEIACYRNKVVDYRQGLEKDLSEVLQTERVFTNVSKGEFAKAKDLQNIFGTKDEEEIATLILSKGQVQVSDKERSQQFEKTNAQIAEWISKNCVQPNSDRPYTISQIRHAMQQANFSVHPTKPLKRQYLDCAKLLQSVIPIQRAKMELLLLVPCSAESREVVEAALNEHEVTWSENDTTSGDIHQYKILVDPSLYRVLNEVIQAVSGAQIEIVTQVVTKQGDVHLETEMEQQDEPMAATIHPLPAPKPMDPVDAASPAIDQLALNEGVEHNSNINRNDDDGSNDDEEDAMVSSRKQQKKNKKKNRKNQRREQEPSSDTSPTAPLSLDSSISATGAPIVPAMISSTGTSAIGTTPAFNTRDGDAPSSRKSCNTCGGSFDTPAAYRAHFKSDWHRFNQKLKLKGVAPISEQEFLLCDSDSFFGGGAGGDLL